MSIPSFMTDCKHPSGPGHTILAQLVLQVKPPPGPLSAPMALPTPAPSPSPSPCPSPFAPPRLSSPLLDSSHLRYRHPHNLLYPRHRLSTPRPIWQRLLHPVNTTVCPSGRPVPAPLPPPYFGEQGLQSAASVCARGPKLSRFVAHGWPVIGFRLSDEGRGEGKLGLLAHQPGDTISFCLPWPSSPSAPRPKVEPSSHSLCSLPLLPTVSAHLLPSSPVSASPIRPSIPP